ncbi:MAG: gamma-glutamyl-phosphate reductase, partial [Methylobacteriaceae bacterium]|nr:gamma-glutamyl-phosphate reductase [Methylobacteriaceae bacterium]
MDVLQLAEEARLGVRDLMRSIGRAARAAAHALALASQESKRGALTLAAAAIRTRADEIIAANARDLDEAKAGGAAAAFLDR